MSGVDSNLIMRVLIYSESDEAKAKQASLRAEGHHASLRNPQFFNPEQFDKSAELVIADDKAILAAYDAVGINTVGLTVPVLIPLAGEELKALVESVTAPTAELALESPGYPVEPPKSKRGK